MFGSGVVTTLLRNLAPHFFGLSPANCSHWLIYLFFFPLFLFFVVGRYLIYAIPGFSLPGLSPFACLQASPQK